MLVYLVKHGFSKFSTVKPLSAINESDSSLRSFSKIPHPCTISTSEIDPSHSSLINVILPDGAENKLLCIVKLKGLWQNNSVQ